MRRRIALVGSRGSGKTTVCARIADIARGRGLRVAGIVSPDRPGEAPGAGGRLVVDLASGEARTLARRAGGIETPGRWQLSEAALDWGAAAACAGAAGADVLIVDEIGWLELRDGRGWVACVALLRDWTGPLAVASVREEYLEAFRLRLGASAAMLEVVRVTPENRDGLPGQLIGEPR
ncbi:MAG TPA: nucleoside-triphosphatase [Vicinamibacterales bacterium]|nr:nucleoside-triphosphatase [Vicinamibacterales bacterium]